jgi:uncharacterized OsmC-like protein
MGTIQQEPTKIVNGIDVRKLNSTIEAISKDPDLASFEFHVINEWVDGAKSRTTVDKLQRADQTIALRQPYVIQADEPIELVGSDSAPSAIISTLHALASCLSVVIAYNAAMRNINIDKLTIEIEGDVDVHGFLGLSTEVRPGFQDIRVEVDLKSSAPRSEVEELVRYAQKVSPLVDTLRNRIPVEINLL